MVFHVMNDDLFNHTCTPGESVYTDSRRVPVHCISADFAMSGGIAVPMANNFKLRDALSAYHGVKSPDCLFVNNVMNLITKDNVWDSPTYASLKESLKICKSICLNKGIKHIVMPKIGCGIDGLNWSVVSIYVKDVFRDTDIDILVCYI